MTTPKVLIIDDEKPLREAMRKALKNEGYELLFAVNGKEGLKMIQEQQPDLIFLDLKMPVMDGIKALEKLKLKPDDPYVVVAITGHGADDETERCFELGVNFFLRKPLSMVEICCLARRCIAMKRAEMELLDHKKNLEAVVAERTTALQELINFQQSLIDSIPLPVCYKDSSLVVLGYNMAFEQLAETLGFNCQDLLGKTMHDALAKDLAPKMHRYDKELLRIGGRRVYEARLPDAAGGKHPTLIHKSIFKDTTGRLAGLVCTFLDMTAERQAREEIMSRSEDLEETNSALRVLLNYIGQTREEMEETVLSNIKEVVFPALEHLGKSLSGRDKKEQVENIRTNLQRVASPFPQKMIPKFKDLSPREIQIADLVRKGRTNKEMARILDISQSAVKFHRNNLRKKMGLCRAKSNLRTYLISQ